MLGDPSYYRVAIITADPEPDLVGATLLGKLRVARRLGAGASGAVYEVEHLLTKHRRALKVLHRDRAASGEAVARLVREAGVAGKIGGACVETYDVGRLADGTPYVLMELLEGRSLRATLDAEGPLSPARAIEIVGQACAGLAPVHAAGMVHRDIKPENLFLEARPEGCRVRLLDFGLVGYVDGASDTLGALTLAGAVAGTHAYMAPEQAGGGAIDARTDVYALGVVLDEALAGRRAGRALGGADARRRACEVGAGVEAGSIQAIVARATALEPADRYADARALGAALAAAAEGASDVAAAHAEPAAPSPPHALDGALAARFEVVRVLQSGAMGTVYEVVHRETRRHRALKRMLPGLAKSAELRRRFAREATVAAEVESEHVVEVVDAGVDPESGAPFLVMELLRGEELGARIARTGGLPRDEALVLLGQVARALDRVHAAGIVHRDLKPQNLFVTRRDDGTPRIKVLDFGIAKLCADDAAALTAGGVLGTPLYMAPEQIDPDAKVGPAADRAALGHIAYTLLAGEPYWAEEAAAGVFALLARLPRGPTEPASVRAARRGRRIDPAFDAWFARATAVDPGARFPEAEAQIAALGAALGAEGLPAAATATDVGAGTAARRVAGIDTLGGASIAPERAKRRSPGVGAVALGAAALIAIGAAATRASSPVAPAAATSRATGDAPEPTPRPTPAATSGVLAPSAVASASASPSARPPAATGASAPRPITPTATGARRSAPPSPSEAPTHPAPPPAPPPRARPAGGEEGLY